MREDPSPKSTDAQIQNAENSNSFTDPAAVANYAKNPPRVVPGFANMQRMAMLLLAERAPDTARVLVVGAGGRLELKVFAQANPDWQFDGVDPSAEMLTLARATLSPWLVGYNSTRATLIPRRKDPLMPQPAYCPCTFLRGKNAWTPCSKFVAG